MENETFTSTWGGVTISRTDCTRKLLFDVKIIHFNLDEDKKKKEEYYQKMKKKKTGGGRENVSLLNECFSLCLITWIYSCFVYTNFLIFAGI